ncbi:hypothetical protein CCAX7_007320 [Capsulimonas corticalis]|uniref:Uncharacterized protein n=2 Tax=Capsulimonas corticalis TaxID=2219043 RepID=A0A402D1N2_9BACT|nr:hypothetical protein CCAX7_007320 [Capsulimonas corticalis]
MPPRPANNKPLSARPLASFENAKPVPKFSISSVANAAGLRLLPEAIHRAYMIAPLTNDQKHTLLATSSHPMQANSLTIPYASLSPSHESEPGRADIMLIAPCLVMNVTQEPSAFFAPSSQSIGPFSSSLKLSVTSPGPGLYLADLVVFPMGIFGPTPGTVNFDIFGTDGAQQTTPLPGSDAPQHLTFLISAPSAGDYPYTISTKDSSWVFTSCTVTKVSGQ